MLRSIREIENYRISATDGEIGKVSDFYFDDAKWTIRYMVADCSGFLSEKHVLISPVAFRQADWATERFHVALTRDQVARSPDYDSDRPVSRQDETLYFGYYGWPHYAAFGGDNLWGVGEYPQALATHKGKPMRDSRDLGEDPHLRSVREVTGYHVQGNDGPIGRVRDFIWDDETWAIRYLVVNTGSWWNENDVLMSPRWTQDINWEEKKVHVDLTRDSIKRSPPWYPEAGVNRQYETLLYDYYGRPTYWTTPGPKKPTARAHP